MSGARGVCQVLKRVAAWSLWCSVVVALYLHLTSASHPHPQQSGDSTLSTFTLALPDAGRKTLHTSPHENSYGQSQCEEDNENEKQTIHVSFPGHKEERSRNRQRNENEGCDKFSFAVDRGSAIKETKANVRSLQNKHEGSQNGELRENGDHFPETLKAQVTKRRKKWWKRRRRRTAINASVSPSEGNAPAGITRSQHLPVENMNCFVKSSCAARKKQEYNKTLVNVFPCMCDDQCHLYGDCCYDHPHALLPSFHALPPACMSLTPKAKRPYALSRTVFLMTKCPRGTDKLLADRCGGDAPPTYLMDIPVFSRTSGIGYANIFCATCHNDTDILKFDISISCIHSVNSTTELENMTYHKGELRWSSPVVVEETGEEKYCLLDVAFPSSLGRWCKPEVVDTCSEDWPIQHHVTRCSTYNYYVQTKDYVYKNKDCALCNGVPDDEIYCLSHFTLGIRSWPQHLPSLTELFEVKGDCKDDEVWDTLHRRCEHVSCGFYFTFVDGKCVWSNKTLPEGNHPFLNQSCFVMEFSQNFSIVFPNQSIYLNETQRLYHLGEYEFNGSWIRVCVETETWTPIMHVMSSVLILISLVCLVLHIIIFIALPKRRNIPSMNLFSMTISLFMAEFLFVTFFHTKVNYISCVITGVLMYYFLCVSFLWMNVMSIDIFRTFYSNTYRAKSRAVFTQYSLYAWLLPLVGVMAAVVVDQMWPEFILAPQFGTHKCWLNNKWGLVAFFTLPSGLVILFNMILYMVSVHNIYAQMKSGEMASSTVRKNGSSLKYTMPVPKTENSMKLTTTGKKVCSVPGEKVNGDCDPQRYKERLRDRLSRGLWSHKKQRVRLILYSKLALMMGMTWIFAFASIHTKSIVFEYLFIVFNGLQGTFIFVSFDLKKKVWEDLRHRMSRREEPHKGDTSSRPPNTMSTSFRAPPDGDYKYRWSSNRRFEGRQTYSTSHSISETQPPQDKAESEV